MTQIRFEGGNLLVHLPSNYADAGKTGPSPLCYCGNHHHGAPADGNYYHPPTPKKTWFI